VGVPRFELGASPTRTERATRLRHTPRRRQSTGWGRPPPLVTLSPQSRHRHVRRSSLRWLRRQRGGRVNSVSLTGNLCTDVDLKELAGEKRVASFLLASDRPSKE